MLGQDRLRARRSEAAADHRMRSTFELENAAKVPAGLFCLIYRITNYDYSYGEHRPYKNGEMAPLG